MSAAVTLLALLLSSLSNFERKSGQISVFQFRWYAKSCPQGPVELTGQQSAGQTSCPWTCMRGRPAPRGPACSSLSHGYPVCKRSGVGCSPHYPHSSAEPSRCYAKVRHIINTLMYAEMLNKAKKQSCGIKGAYYITATVTVVIHIHIHPHTNTEII